MASCSATDLLDAAKCWTPLGPVHLQAITAALLCRILKALDPMAACDVSDLISSSKCLLGLPQDQMLAIIAQLLCEILTAGGAGGFSCITGSEADPVDPPTCTYALHYRTDTGTVWLWLPATAEWSQIIGGAA